MPDDDTTSRSPRPRLGLPRALSSLKHRDYALFASGQLISLSGSWMQSTAQGYLVYHLTKSAIYLGLVAAMTTIPVLILTLPAGSLADRWPKRKLLLVTQTILLIQALVLGILDATGAIRPWHLLILALVSGTAMAMDAPARQSFTYDLVGKEDLLNGVALNSGIFNFTRIIGPSAAGLVIAVYGTHICFLLNALSYVAALVALIMMRNVPTTGHGRKDPIIKQTMEGLRYSVSNVLTRELLILTAVVSVFCMQYQVLMPAYARKDLGLDAKGLGALMSAAGIGALLGASIVATAGGKIRSSTVIICGMFVMPLGLWGATASHSLHFSMFCIAVIGLGMMSFMAVSNSIILMDAPEDMKGRIMAIRTLVFMGLSPLMGSMLLGWIAQSYSVSAAMRLGAIACAIAAFALLVRSRKLFRTAEDKPA